MGGNGLVTLEGIVEKPRVFVTSDLHLDHTNIIQYCNRPFSDTRHMNQILVENWNATVGHDDLVYFLGDMSYGMKARSADFWLEKLHGNVIFIRGNHDRLEKVKAYNSFFLDYEGVEFYMAHTPRGAPRHWQGWIIHGHKHNNQPLEYPFFNRENRTINVSVELTGYRPVNLDGIVEKIKAEAAHPNF